MKATDLPLLTSVSAPTAAPDGSRVVVAVSHPSFEADADVGQLWSVPLSGETPRRITRGFRDTAPRFSPDGALIAFVRGEPGAPGQLHVVDARGGEPIALTDIKLGVGEFRWSPDSTRIAYVARVPEQGRYGTVDKIAPAAEPARRVTTIKYKANGLGHVTDRPAQVFVVDVPPLDAEPPYPSAPMPDGETPDAATVPESRQLTDAAADHASPRFLPDGRIAFVVSPHDATDLRTQVAAVAADGKGATEPVLSFPTLSIDSFDVAPDGTLYFLAQDVGESGLDFVAANSALYRAEHDGQPVRLTDPETVDLGDVGSYLAFDRDAVLAQNRTHGTRQLLRVTRDGEATALTEGDLEIEGHAVAGETVVVTFSSPDTVGDVAIVRHGALEPLTDFCAALRDSGVVRPIELTVTGRDGTDIHGWVAKPAGEGPHPVLLNIHGGPHAAYSVHLFDETQVLVDAGYAVVYCNPRGSAGYGRSFGRAIRHAMGTVDMHDVLDFLDGALDADTTLDHERLGILGGSYGGYLTAWIIAHDHRFRAAIVERGYLDPEAFIGSSDIGWFFGQQYTGIDREGTRAQSPQEVAHLVRTPSLVIHSEQDLRCPLGQAETWYATLKLGGVESELLLFPGENHELSRSGRPRHRLQRFEAILDWFKERV